MEALSPLPLDGECEEHFFGLMSILTRNSEDNSREVKAMRSDLEKYSSEAAASKPVIKEKITSIIALAD